MIWAPSLPVKLDIASPGRGQVGVMCPPGTRTTQHHVRGFLPQAHHLTNCKETADEPKLRAVPVTGLSSPKVSGSQEPQRGRGGLTQNEGDRETGQPNRLGWVGRVGGSDNTATEVATETTGELHTRSIRCNNVGSVLNVPSVTIVCDYVGECRYSRQMHAGSCCLRLRVP